MKSFKIAAVLVALSAGSVAAQQQTPPGPGPLRPYEFPKIEQFTLANGMNVVLVEKHTLPIISSRIILDAGALREPADKLGVANITATLLSEGTKDLSGSEIAKRMDAMGAEFGTFGAFSGSFVDLTALKGVYPAALALAAKTITEPSFPQGEFERAKSEAIAAFAQSHARTSGLASDAFFRAAFDTAAPFSRPAGLTLQSITRDDVLNWAKTMYAPNATTVLMVGDVTEADARNMLTSAFGSWTTQRAPLPAISNAPRSAKGVRVVLVDRPASVQSTIMIGRGGFDATSADYIPLLVANHVLGGAVSSRLNANLREKHGFTYGAFSRLDLRKGGGAFNLSMEARTDATDSAVVEAMNEYRRIATEPIPQPELQSFSNNLVSGFPSGVQTVQGLESRLQNLILWGLPIDFYKTYREKLAAVTPADAERAAATLDPGNVVIAVAGDLSKIEAPIRALNLGTVEVWDANGNKIR